MNAFTRDSQFNQDERRVYDGFGRFLNGCKGPTVDRDCLHPSCHRATDAGLSWSLMGWRKDGRVVAQDVVLRIGHGTLRRVRPNDFVRVTALHYPSTR